MTFASFTLRLALAGIGLAGAGAIQAQQHEVGHLISPATPSQARPSESLSLNYTKIEFKTTPMQDRAAGAGGSGGAGKVHYSDLSVMMSGTKKPDPAVMKREK